MNFFLDKIARLKLGWNEAALTERDFHRICKRFKVSVVEMPLRTDGFYYRVMGRDYIAIDSKLSGAAKLLVQFHELAHFLLHTPESGATANFHGVGRKTRQEVEADAFALCALIPKSILAECSPGELIADGISPEILAERMSLHERYGI